jgi:hypothetical protein
MIDEQVGVMAIEAELEQARGGMYARAMQAGIVAGDRETFTGVVETLEDDIRRDKRGIGSKLHEKELVRHSTDKHGNLKYWDDEQTKPVYTIPSSLSTAKSVVGNALDAGIDLGTEKEPESFSAVRTALKAAKEAAKEASLTGDAKRRAELRETLNGIADAAEGISGKALTALIKLVASVAKEAETAAEKAA